MRPLLLKIREWLPRCWAFFWASRLLGFTVAVVIMVGLLLGGFGPQESRTCAEEGASCLASRCCADSRLKCYELDRGWAACQATCKRGVDRGMGPWTCKVLASHANTSEHANVLAPSTSEPAAFAVIPLQSTSTPSVVAQGTPRATSSATTSMPPTSSVQLAQERPQPSLPTSASTTLTTTSASTTSPLQSSLPSTSARASADLSEPLVPVTGNHNVVAPSVPPSTTTLSPARPANATGNPPVQLAREISINGASMAQLPVATYAAGGGGTIAGDQLTLRHNSGYSMVTSRMTDWEDDKFALFKLLGRTISFTVDLSKVGCACNLAVYFISGPAKDTGGEPSKGTCSDSPYYCDANQVCGQWCPEIDMMEANTRVFAATPHKCDPPSSTGHYSNCDRAGCGQNTRDQWQAYGPGPSFQIDTTRAFVVRTSYASWLPRTLTGVTTVLEQEDRQVMLDHSNCDPDYLSQLSDAMAAGMVLRITYWGDKPETMAWLDVPPCGQESCGIDAGEAHIRNITVTSIDTTSTVLRLKDMAPGGPVPNWNSLNPRDNVFAFAVLSFTTVYILAVFAQRSTAGALSNSSCSNCVQDDAAAAAYEKVGSANAEACELPETSASPRALLLVAQHSKAELPQQLEAGKSKGPEWVAFHQLGNKVAELIHESQTARRARLLESGA